MLLVGIDVTQRHEWEDTFATASAQHIREILGEEGISGENIPPYVNTRYGRTEEMRSISASG
jgi:hypothetical protein